MPAPDRLLARTRFAVLLITPILSLSLHAQEPTLEYRVKAAYLFNFVKFVEWPPEAAGGPLTICVAGRNPFGSVLSETIRGETVNGRPLVSRVILEPEPGCDVLFIPRGAAAPAYLRAARGTATLTIGEEPEIIARGGIISLDLEGTSVRFTINPAAAERGGLRLSSRLLQLARIANDRGEIR